jgi:hypothetical protein
MKRYLRAYHFAAKHFAAAHLAGLAEQDTPAAGGVKPKRRRPFRVGTPWVWMPPPAPLRRNRRRKECELLCFMHP